MGSRLRENPSRVMECWCEIVAPQGKDNPPWIIQKFPRTYDEEEVLKSVPQFTFPCSFEKSAVQHFSFVLTNLESKFLYGFCRHAPDSETAIVILSHLPWHELFYKLLNHCSTLICNKNSGDLWSFLQSLYQVCVPAPGTKLSINYGDNKYFVAECPNHLNLPSIPENRNLSEYYSAVDIDNMMVIFASMLNERRIIVTSERVSRLSACVQAANSLIYPMSWQHIFIPVLPEHLIDYLHAPMPFLIGIAWPLMKRVRPEDIGDVVILNADTNNVITPHSDLVALPEEVVSALKKNLSPPNNLLGDGIARAFLKALVHIIGNYREALQFREEDRKISFSEERFVEQRPQHIQPFVQKMLQLQIFRQFIEERIDLLNSGLHTSDEFELEVSVFGERSSSKMRQIISNVKKESGAIMKNVKNKTNPAMKSAVKSVTKSGKNVREKSKITYKELRGRMKEKQPKPIESDRYINGDLLPKPQSAPSSPTHPQRRSSKKTVSGIYDGYSAKITYTRTSQVSRSFIADSSSFRKTSDDSQKTPSPQELDLIGEMEDALKTQLTAYGKHTSASSLSSGTLQQETTSNVSMNSSFISSNEPTLNSGSSASLMSSNNPFGDTVQFSEQKLPVVDNLQNGVHNLFEGQSNADLKLLSASLTSLPQLDLSLDIPLPPPLFPQLSSSLFQPSLGPSSLPPSLAHYQRDDEKDKWEDKKDKYDYTPPPHIPKIKSDISNEGSFSSHFLFESTLDPVPSSSNFSSCSTSGVGERQLEGASTVITAFSSVASNNKTNGVGSAYGCGPNSPCRGSSSSPQSLTRPKAQTLPCGSSLDTCSSHTTPNSASRFWGISNSPVTAPHKRSSSTVIYSPNMSVCRIRAFSSSFPKYDVSPSFSASLAKFSAKDSNASYFFSFLSRPFNKSTESLFDGSATNTSLKIYQDVDQNAKDNLVSPMSPPDIIAYSKCETATLAASPPDLQRANMLPVTDIMSSSFPPSLSSLTNLIPTEHSRLSDHFPIVPPPRYRRRRKKPSIPHHGLMQTAESESGQDLLFLESPKEEEFDPLLSKDVPPPVPIRQSKNFKQTAGLPFTEAVTNAASSVSHIPSNAPKRLSPTRYLPFGALQSYTVNAAQNPMYNQHQPPFNRINGPPLQDRAAAHFPFNITPATEPNLFKGPPPVRPSQSTGSVAAFAATLLSTGNVNNNPTSSQTFSTGGVSSRPICNRTGSAADKGKVQTHIMSEKDLLGDFSSEFQKLSLPSKDKNSNL